MGTGNSGRLRTPPKPGSKDNFGSSFMTAAVGTNSRHDKIFYGWYVVAAAFLNFFFIIGIIFYGFPVFYASFVEALGFTRAQVTQGFFLGFLIIGLPSGLLAGAVIDRIGA